MQRRAHVQVFERSTGRVAQVTRVVVLPAERGGPSRSDDYLYGEIQDARHPQPRSDFFECRSVLVYELCFLFVTARYAPYSRSNAPITSSTTPTLESVTTGVVTSPANNTKLPPTTAQTRPVTRCDVVRVIEPFYQNLGVMFKIDTAYSGAEQVLQGKHKSVQ